MPETECLYIVVNHIYNGHQIEAKKDGAKNYSQIHQQLQQKPRIFYETWDPFFL